MLGLFALRRGTSPRGLAHRRGARPFCLLLGLAGLASGAGCGSCGLEGAKVEGRVRPLSTQAKGAVGTDLAAAARRAGLPVASLVEAGRALLRQAPAGLRSRRQGLALPVTANETTPQPALPGTDTPDRGRLVPGEAIVMLRDGLEDLDRLATDPVLAAYRFTPRVWGGPKVLSVGIEDAADPTRPIGPEETAFLAERLDGHPALRGASPNYLRVALAQPNDAYYELQWHYQQIGLEAAWEITTGSKSVVVAVIDDGVSSHLEVSPRLLPGYDLISDPEIAGDGDGRDSDPSEVPGTVGGQSVWHGLHVAGTIGATSDDQRGVAGVDWACRILPVRVLGIGGGTSIDIIAGINWAVGVEVPGTPLNQNPADVLNLSLGGGPLNQAEQDAIDAAVARGAVVVVAAGNENRDASNQSLAGYDNVIVVGATDYRGHRAPYSNWGAAVDVMAPGGDIEADANADGYPDGVLSTYLDPSGTEAQVNFLQGTSMASPHVAGIAALMKALDPSITHQEVERILKETADAAFRCAEGCGAGLVDPAAALRAVGGASPNAPPRLVLSVDRLNLGTARNGRITVRNVGGQSIAFQSRLEGGPTGNISVRGGSGTLGAGQSQTLELEATTTGLADGTYQSVLVVSGAGQEARAAVLFTVGEPPVPDVGTVLVGTFVLDENDEAVVGGETKTTLDEGYRFDFESDPGEWYVVALADVNGDGELGDGDLLGFWRNPDQLETVSLETGKTLKGIDFPLMPLSLGDVSAPPCEDLRRCWEGCAGDQACIDACPVSPECDHCFSQVIQPCVDQSCPDGSCVCTTCSGAVDQCFGPLACTGSGGGGGGGGGGPSPVGGPCASDGDCAGGFLCDTSVAGGYCTADCFDTGQCAMGACIGFDGDGDGTVDSAFCLATCTDPSQCPRSGDLCQSTDVGGVCVPPS
ncbi:MAG: hypothetical protein D6729_08240 [Deltaproteobacteria bacterium]|nr:MAG: hypothetical protein D6729_08240 [Deltaproteobacteria bacterium]